MAEACRCPGGEERERGGRGVGGRERRLTLTPPMSRFRFFPLTPAAQRAFTRRFRCERSRGARESSNTVMKEVKTLGGRGGGLVQFFPRR